MFCLFEYFVTNFFSSLFVCLIALICIGSRLDIAIHSRIGAQCLFRNLTISSPIYISLNQKNKVVPDQAIQDEAMQVLEIEN